MICRYVFPDGVRCANTATTESGHCQGHPPKDGGGSGRTAAWVSAIAAAGTAVANAIHFAWPYVAPYIHVILGAHTGFFGKIDGLLQEVLTTDEKNEQQVAEIEKKIAEFQAESNDMVNSLLTEGPVSMGAAVDHLVREFSPRRQYGSVKVELAGEPMLKAREEEEKS